MEDIIKNHIEAIDVRDFPKKLQKYRDILEGRSLLVKKSDVLPVECIVRGYISGSGWKSYQQNGTVCGIKLPEKSAGLNSLKTCLNPQRLNIPSSPPVQRRRKDMISISLLMKSKRPWAPIRRHN
jgi:hypothetical protein